MKYIRIGVRSGLARDRVCSTVAHARAGQGRKPVITSGVEVDEAGGVGEDGLARQERQGLLQAGDQRLELLHEVGAVGQLLGVGLICRVQGGRDLRACTEARVSGFCISVVKAPAASVTHACSYHGLPMPFKHSIKKRVHAGAGALRQPNAAGRHAAAAHARLVRGMEVGKGQPGKREAWRGQHSRRRAGQQSRTAGSSPVW